MFDDFLHQPVSVGKGREGRRLVAYCIVETLSSYFFTRLTSIGCFSELRYMLWGHSIGSGGPIWFCMVLQAKISIPRGEASIYSFS